jgi:acetylglutamate kinase
VRPVVIKVGGGALAGGALEDLPDLLAAGYRIAIVHGGGMRLTRMLDALGIPTRFHAGLRVTDEETMEVAEDVFAGGVNKSLVRGLGELGVRAAGISGTDGPTLEVEPVPDLGRVGKVVRVGSHLIETLWTGGFVPIVAPVGLGPEGAYNINADSAAAALAVGLGAGNLLVLTDVDGLLEEGETVEALVPDRCEAYIDRGLAVGGMVPKLRAAAEAARGGVEATILNGNTKGTLAAVLAGEHVGTLVSEGVAACKQ